MTSSASCNSTLPVHAVGFWISSRSEFTVTQPSPLYLTRSQASVNASGRPTGHSSISHTFAFSHLRKQVRHGQWAGANPNPNPNPNPNSNPSALELNRNHARICGLVGFIGLGYLVVQDPLVHESQHRGPKVSGRDELDVGHRARSVDEACCRAAVDQQRRRLDAQEGRREH